MPNSNIRLIIERNIPYVAGLLDDYATVRYLAPEEITPKAVRETDGMIIRTRTKCNEELLKKSEVKMIATATIGMDHIDLDYCKSRSITVINAPGCNAPAVAQYVFATIMQVINRPLRSYTLGIVGVGHVGSIVERWAKALDMNVLVCDPLRQEAEGGDQWVDLDTIARKADIITFHTPLTREGEHATYHMADEAFFAKLRRSPIIINSARGEIVDTPALIEARKAGKVGGMIIDCWENEPRHRPRTVGYGRCCHSAHCRIFARGQGASIADSSRCHYDLLYDAASDSRHAPAARTGPVGEYQGDTRQLRPHARGLGTKKHPEDFESIRNSYPLRHEAPEGTTH